MARINTVHTDQNFDHTDIFVVANNAGNTSDFVTIDHSHADLSDAVMIDISNDENMDVFAFDTQYDTESFVMLDDDVIVSGFTFTDEDFNATIVDFDIVNDIHGL